MKSLPFWLIVALFLLYGSFLSQVPVHLNQDELGFALNAYSLAQTGFDENGRFLPLYFWHLGQMWATPVMTYWTAFVLKVVPFSEANIRLATVLVAMIDLGLIWLVARKFFQSKVWATLAMLFLALTPAHFINSRLLLDNLYPLPFFLGWLLLIQLYLEKKQIKYLFFSAFLLGVGVHSYHATKVAMPVYFLITVALMFSGKQAFFKKKLLKILVLTFLFVLPLIPLYFWLKVYPDTLSDQVRYTNLYDQNLPVWQGVLALLEPKSLLVKADVFVNYFHPAFLFLRGDNSLIHSTQKAGVFLLAYLILLPVGLYQLFKNKTTINKVVLISFFIAPFPAALVGDHYRISRILLILPLASLIATLGLKTLWLSKRTVFQAGTIALVFLSLIQFGLFYKDYLQEYPQRSYRDFRYNIAGALETAISHQGKLNSRKIYLDKDIEFIDRYWRFYLIKHNKQNLLSKTAYISGGADFDSLERNSLLVFDYNHVDGLKETLGGFKKIESISESDGLKSFYLYSSQSN